MEGMFILSINHWSERLPSCRTQKIGQHINESWIIGSILPKSWREEELMRYFLLTRMGDTIPTKIVWIIVSGGLRSGL
jgi:hypothetical protein